MPYYFYRLLQKVNYASFKMCDSYHKDLHFYESIDIGTFYFLATETFLIIGITYSNINSRLKHKLSFMLVHL